MTEAKVEYVVDRYPIPDLKDGLPYMVWMFGPKEVPNTGVLRARFRARYGWEAEDLLRCENTRLGLIGIALGPTQREDEGVCREDT